MEVSSSHQICVFFICIVSGMVCCSFFDLQRFVRRLLKAGSVRTMLEDALFAVVCGATVLVTGFLFNDGQMRYYQFAGVISGALFYATFLSGIVMRFLEILKDILTKIFIRPLFKIAKIIFIPISRFAAVLKRIFLKLKRHLKALKKGGKALKKRIKML